MIKRALAATLCLIMVFALLPKTARADGVQTELDIRQSSIEIGAGSVTGKNSSGDPVTVPDPDGYRIIGGGISTTNNVTVTGGTHSITLVNVQIAGGGEQRI